MTTITAPNVSHLKAGDTKTPKFTAKGFDKSDAWKVIAQLNQALAHAIDLRSRAKQAYWSAKGENLYTLQKMLNEFGHDLDLSADKLSARIMALGGIPARTVSNVAAASKLPAYPTGAVHGSEHLDALITSYGLASEQLPVAMKFVIAESDFSTADVITQFAKKLDEHVSLLIAHIPAEWMETQKKHA